MLAPKPSARAGRPPRLLLPFPRGRASAIAAGRRRTRVARPLPGPASVAPPRPEGRGGARRAPRVPGRAAPSTPRTSGGASTPSRGAQGSSPARAAPRALGPCKRPPPARPDPPPAAAAGPFRHARPRAARGRAPPPLPSPGGPSGRRRPRPPRRSAAETGGTFRIAMAAAGRIPRLHRSESCTGTRARRADRRPRRSRIRAGRRAAHGPLGARAGPRGYAGCGRRPALSPVPPLARWRGKWARPESAAGTCATPRGSGLARNGCREARVRPMMTRPGRRGPADVLLCTRSKGPSRSVLPFR